MATSGEPSSCGDIEQGHRLPHLDAGGGGGSVDDDDESLCFSDADDRSWRSRRESDPSLSSFDGYRASASSRLEFDGGTLRDGCRRSCDSHSSIDLGAVELVVTERDCRICHLALTKSAAPELDGGASIVLGCSCKNDLSLAHRQCAETWFKIKGNKTCEICRSVAHNVIGPGEAEAVEQWSEADASTAPPAAPSETRRFWQGHRFLNFLLACLVFAFVISWLFHFNVPG